MAALIAVEAVAATTLVFGIIDQARLGTTDGNDWVRLTATAAMLGWLGWVLASRRSDNPIGWITLGIAFGLGLSGLGDVWAVFALGAHPGLPAGVWGAWVSERLTAIVGIGLPLTLLLFPEGQLLSRRWRVVVWCSVANVIVLVIAGAFDPRPLREGGKLAGLHDLANPIGIDGLKSLLVAVGTVTVIGYSLALVAGLVALVLRYRRGVPAVRVQLRWIVIAFAVYIARSFIPSDVQPGSPMILELIATAALCIVIAAAILRYRLFDIDVVVNRALVYTLLSLAVIGGYVAIVAALGAVLQARSSLTVSLIATGVVAAMFSPLRARLQRSVNRLTYGDRHEPSRALARMSERIAAGTPEELLGGIASSVAEALRSQYVRVGAGPHLEASCGSAPVGVSLHEVPLVFAGDQTGVLTVAPRNGEGRLSHRDAILLDDLARQAAVAVRAVALSVELQRSRERLVVAREEERRRLRRDLHDGLGPTLAGISVRADAARRLVADDPIATAGALATIKADAHDAIAEIRRLVADLRPPSLDQIGLIGALRNEAIRYAPALDVAVTAPSDLPELPAAVEVAVFRITAEALANAARHSGADHVAVELGWSARSEIVVTIADDGHGIATDARSGVGLSSMRERATELDGWCEISADPNGGTRVRAVIPLTGSDASTRTADQLVATS